MNLAEMEMRKVQATIQPKKYYLIYCRKSSEAEDRQVESINDQLKIAKEIARERNLKIAEIFTESCSAKKPGRKDFNRLIETIDTRNDIKGIIGWKLNRLFRNPEDEGKIRQRLSDGRITEIITPNKTYLEADSDFTMAVEGAQAQRFIRDLTEDSARGTKSKLDRGMAPILAPPGYRNCVEKRQGERDIEAVNEQFTLVRNLFEIFLTGNFSVQQLWFKAEELGVKSNRGKIISKTQLYKMLRNPFYTGTRYIYKGNLHTNGVHQRMLLDEEFNLVQEILSKGSHPRGQIHKDLLTGLIKCGECGRSITTEVKTKHYKNGKFQVFVYYRCTKKWRGQKCHQPYIRAELLEEQVMKYLDSIKLSPRFIEWAIKWLKAMHENQAEVREAKYKSMEEAYQGTLRKIERLVDLMLSGIISIEEGKEKKQILEEEKQRLSNELSKIDNHVTEWSNLAIETFNFVKNAQERFANGTIEQRKTILRVIGSNLTLKDKRLYIEARKPFTYIQKVAYQLKEDKMVEPIDLPTITPQSVFSGPKYSIVGG